MKLGFSSIKIGSIGKIIPSTIKDPATSMWCKNYCLFFLT
jgi:hypothetical protein